MWRGGKYISVVSMSAELGEMCKQVSFICTPSPTYILGLAYNGETVTVVNAVLSCLVEQVLHTTLKFCTGPKLAKKFLSDYSSAPLIVTNGALHILYEGQNVENSEGRAWRSVQT